MQPEQVLDISRFAITTMLMVSGPIMVVALVVGLIIALFQALTSIQEVTLTFVPKILLVFLALMALMPFMADQMLTLARELFSLIGGGGGNVFS